VLMTGPVQFEFAGKFDPALFAPTQPSPASGGGIGRGP
jgi:hypothetical protein